MSTEWNDLVKNVAVLAGEGDRCQAYKDLCFGTLLTQLWSITEEGLKPSADDAQRIRDIIKRYDPETYEGLVMPVMKNKYESERKRLIASIDHLKFKAQAATAEAAAAVEEVAKAETAAFIAGAAEDASQVVKDMLAAGDITAAAAALKLKAIKEVKDKPETGATDEDDWEEVYNSTDERNGEPREQWGQPGTFYQTYGNGGGEGGHGGYWVREGGDAVWSVAGDKFKFKDGWTLLVRPQDSMRGQVAAVRLVRRVCRSCGLYQSCDTCKKFIRIIR